jgi:hypothetical protein
MGFFRRVEIPPEHRSNTLARQARWLTWGPSVIRFVDSFRSDIDKLHVPRIISVHGCEPYDSSYSYILSRLDRRFAEHVLSLSEELLSFRIGTTLNFVTGMLNHPLESLRLWKLFALLRSGLVKLMGDSKSALNAPVFAARSDDGFPLHADLFRTERLWLVFDHVADGKGGASLFLPMATLLNIVRSLECIPEEIAKQMLLLVLRVNSDSFDHFFDLLYWDDNPWRLPLARALNRARRRIRLRRGEGYLIHDRHWLHGRDAILASVPRSRFRRLVFGVQSQRHIRTSLVRATAGEIVRRHRLKIRPRVDTR